MYSASFSKIIVSMNSPWLELSNGILFAIFRYRLTSFRLFRSTSVKNRPAAEYFVPARREEVSDSVGPSGSERNQRGTKERNCAIRVDMAHIVWPHVSCLMRYNNGAPSSRGLLFFQKLSPAPKLALLHLAAPTCTK
jgi:hypothetical protein